MQWRQRNEMGRRQLAAIPVPDLDVDVHVGQLDSGLELKPLAGLADRDRGRERAKGLALLEEHGDKITLLFTNVQMPGRVNGFGLARVAASIF